MRQHHRQAPLPPDPREAPRGRLRSLLMVVVAVALVAAFTWSILSWREAQVQQELQKAQSAEQLEEISESVVVDASPGAPA